MWARCPAWSSCSSASASCRSTHGTGRARRCPPGSASMIRFEGRAGLQRCSRATFNAVPGLVFLCGVALSVSLAWRGFSLVHGLANVLWAVPAYLLIHWRLGMIRPRRRQARVHLDRLYSRRGVWAWLTTVGPRLRTLRDAGAVQPGGGVSAVDRRGLRVLLGCIRELPLAGRELPGAGAGSRRSCSRVRRLRSWVWPSRLDRSQR